MNHSLDGQDGVLQGSAGPVLPSIRRLFDGLAAERVLYCHWKSNAFLDLAIRGEDDLDLLLSPAHHQAFAGLAGRLGLLETAQVTGLPEIPGILSYYGYDESSDRLVHLHVHYKLILGHDLTKNYHLPVENRYLAALSGNACCPIPVSEFEFVVFVIRMTLKHATWTALVNGQGRWSDRERGEMAYLENLASREGVSRILEDVFPSLGPALFKDCLSAARPSSPIRLRVQAAYRLRKALRGCALRSEAVDDWLQFWRRAAIIWKGRILRKPLGEKLKNGGLLMAVVGGDGSGKTTVVEGISEWLSPPFLVRKVHLGKPAWSLMTVLVRGVLKLGRIFGLWRFSRVPYEALGPDGPDVFPGYPTVIREVCTARDRYLSYRKARREADRGALVLCDRFPVPGVISTDGPQVERMTRMIAGRRFIRFLDSLEKKYYAAIFPPDLLIALKADPETNVSRKPEEEASYVRARSREVHDGDWTGAGAHLINVDAPKSEVLREVKRLLWAHL